MDVGVIEPSGRLLDALAASRPALSARAETLDRDGGDLAPEIGILRDIGALTAPLPRVFGGLALGTDVGMAGGCAAVLRAVGRSGLPLGRLYEGHVNAVRLVMRHGTMSQRIAFAAEVSAGALGGVWATDAASALRLEGDTLRGGKGLCSGIGLVTRPIVTAALPGGGRRMVLLDGAVLVGRTEVTSWTARGMRASATGSVDLDGVWVTDAHLLGGTDDYIAQPDFSGGAWRVLAVLSGGLAALVDAYRAALVARGREGDPHQRARAGRVFIASRTVWAFARLAADAAEGPHAVAEVNLARAACDAAITDAVKLIERSLGLSAFLRPDPCERLIRDITTYMRQPALDAALCEGAAHFMETGDACG